MLCLKWSFVLLSILYIVSIRTSETETESHGDDVASLALEDHVEALEPDKKKLEGFKVEKESKTLAVDIQYKDQIEEELYNYTSPDKKYAYSRIQAAVKDLSDIIKILNTYPMPDLAFDPEDYYNCNTILEVLLYRLMPPFATLVDTITRGLEAAMRKVRKGNTQAYGIAHDQFLSYCKSLQSMLEDQAHKVPKDSLTESEIKSTMEKLIEKGVLVEPKAIIETLYARMVLARSRHEGVFARHIYSFNAMKHSILEFQRQGLEINLSREAIEGCKGLLRQLWEKNHIGSPFNLILDLFIKSFSSMLALGASTVECGEVFLAYIKQVEDLYWGLYGSRIHAFDVHYTKAKAIAEAGAKFIQSHPEKAIAKAMVKEFVIRQPKSIIDAAFEHSQDGVVSKETLKLLQKNLHTLFILLYKYKGNIGIEDSGISEMYDGCLNILIQDLLYLEDQGIGVDSEVLLEALTSMFQDIRDKISYELGEEF